MFIGTMLALTNPAEMELWFAGYPAHGQCLIARNQWGHEVNCGQVEAWEAITSFYFVPSVPRPGFRVRTNLGDFDIRIPLPHGFLPGNSGEDCDNGIELPQGSYGRCVYEPGKLVSTKPITHFSWPGVVALAIV